MARCTAPTTPSSASLRAIWTTPRRGSPRRWSFSARRTTAGPHTAPAHASAPGRSAPRAADVTALLGSHVVLEALSGMARRRAVERGELPPFDPGQPLLDGR